MFKTVREDLNTALLRDPAARNKFEVFLTYPGVHAIWNYRISHWLWQHNVKLIARMLSNRARRRTGIEIHPAVVVGKRVFIDHGLGVGMALQVVAGQLLGLHPTLHHPGQLPGQVEGIAHAGVQALPDPWRGDVGGISGQADPAMDEFARHPRVVRVDPGPDDLQPLGVRHVPLEQSLDLVGRQHLLAILAGEEHELPAPAPSGEINDGPAADATPEPEPVVIADAPAPAAIQTAAPQPLAINDSYLQTPPPARPARRKVLWAIASVLLALLLGAQWTYLYRGEIAA